MMIGMTEEEKDSLHNSVEELKTAIFEALYIPQFVSWLERKLTR